MNNKAKIAIVLSIALIFGVGFIVYKRGGQTTSHKNACASINPDDVTMQAQLIDNSKYQYATSSRQILGKSTDGGVQMNYSKDGKILLSEVGLFGETVNYKASYFIQDKKVYYLHEEVTRYEKSIYVEDFDPSSKGIEIRDYYLDKDQNLCSWSINQKPQPIDEKAKNYVNEAISELWR
jgi:hypothetical protein